MSADVMRSVMPTRSPPRRPADTKRCGCSSRRVNCAPVGSMTARGSPWSATPLRAASLYERSNTNAPVARSNDQTPRRPRRHGSEFGRQTDEYEAYRPLAPLTPPFHHDASASHARLRTSAPRGMEMPLEGCSSGSDRQGRVTGRGAISFSRNSIWRIALLTVSSSSNGNRPSAAARTPWLSRNRR
jgi:hypothetical protein